MSLRNPLSTLPSEINHDIFLRLEGRHLVTAQSVSKEWYSFVQDIKAFHIGQPRLLILSRVKDIHEAKRLKVRSIRLDLRTENTSQFTVEPQVCAITAHRFRNSIDADRDLCSCNGLVLLIFEKHIILWNPLVRRSTKVLELPRLHMLTWKELGGLCYDPSSNEYKVVLLLSCKSSTIRIGDQYVIVSGLKNKGWQKLSFPYEHHTTRAGVNFNNTLHWIVRDKIRSPSLRTVHVNKVLYYDPVDNTFKQLPTPTKNNLEEENHIYGTGIIEGCFCIGQWYQGRNVIQVSVMKEYGNPESWVTIFAIPILGFGRHFNIYNLTFFSLHKSKNLTIMCKDNGRLYVYDGEEDKLEQRFFHIPKDEDESRVRMCFYAQSFELPYGVSWRNRDRRQCRYI
ncbi:unnamed protein product [Cuscuta epithymum]|uniref:F-box domain-containing protein n=1 Tax=Cuscuta epithymum TaxID=186058 RepID=A0AAV0GKY7_9ASTE|nr:unnamed protein product [Cuscuta epithymum]